MRVIYMSALVLAAAACGGIVSGNDDGGGGGGDGGSGSKVCPASAPSEGTSCPRNGLECEYGDNTNYLCNTVAVCNGSSWTYYKNDPTFCSTGLQPGCAASSSQVPQGSSCAPQGTRCNYPDVVCECAYPAGPVQIDDAGNTVASWVCEQPVQGCPIPRPKLGSACTAPESLQCDYGSCSLAGGALLTCQGGAWERASVACPL
jgi:hypothetical protein